MSNGQRCCILQICCPPPPVTPATEGAAPPERVNPKAVESLAEWLAEVCESEGSFQDIARKIFEDYDLVPAGAARYIYQMYGPEFGKAAP